MPFLGTTPTQGFVSSFPKQSFTPNGSTTVFTLTNPVASANDLEVFVGNVRQEPTTAYTAAGTTLTMSEAPDTGLNFYVINKSFAQVTTTPPANSISTDKIVNSAITDAKIGGMAASKLTGAMPALDGSALTSVGTVKHIKTQTGTNASSVDFLHGTNGVVFDDTYGIYEFIVHYFYTAGGHELRIEPSQDGSGFSNSNTLGYVAAGYRSGSSNSSWNTHLGSNGFFRSTVSAGDAENEIMAGTTRVFSPYDSAKNTVSISNFGGLKSSTIYYVANIFGGMSGAGRTHGIRFKSETSNVYTKISLYGIKDS